jgi:hypothetical protein
MDLLNANTLAFYVVELFVFILWQFDLLRLWHCRDIIILIKIIRLDRRASKQTRWWYRNRSTFHTVTVTFFSFLKLSLEIFQFVFQNLYSLFISSVQFYNIFLKLCLNFIVLLFNCCKLRRQLGILLLLLV